MEAHPRELRVYETAEGVSPFDNWLESLRDARTRARIEARLERLRMGNFGDCKGVGEGVLELRLTFGAGYRGCLADDGDRIVLLLTGGTKSTQKIDIELAHIYWQDYKGGER